MTNKLDLAALVIQGDEVALDRADRQPLDLVEELRNLGIRAELAEADLTDAAAPARLFDELEDRLGRFMRPSRSLARL